jgi:hypothetical protein
MAAVGALLPFVRIAANVGFPPNLPVQGSGANVSKVRIVDAGAARSE